MREGIQSQLQILLTTVVHQTPLFLSNSHNASTRVSFPYSFSGVVMWFALLCLWYCERFGLSSYLILKASEISIRVVKGVFPTDSVGF